MKKNQSKDYTALVIVWLATIICLFIFVPRAKIREASLIFLFKQLLTWSLGLIVVNLGLIRYPNRFFKNVNGSSFTFEYFVFPSICVFFNLYYPTKRKFPIRFLYYWLYSGILTGIEVLFEKFTSLIQYRKWRWYHSFISFGITFYLSRVYYQWFYKKTNPFSI
ncbi:CBO0543 family protein [Bacillus sp. JCM 19034]|uniref:CBO0543 family protein n=1 Tax=Bacillus sp. JCM 19034 TaxID=1481928 RepID=UPI0007810BAE|nr:CBO0543 family protein [Bacillus sp. JCM 19034]